MSNWAGGVLTAAGRTLQAKVEAGTTALILTKIKLGDGTESMDAVDNLTDLVGPKAVLGISSSVADGDHATITGVMLSTQLQAGFWCREWGLFARDPDAGEILYMVTIDAQPEWLPASTAAAQVSATYAMNIAVANATNIEVQIDPAGLVDVEMLQSYMGLAKRSTAVALGDTALLENIPAGYFLECTTPGTTGATAPVITSVTAGQTITDGSVVWTVRQCLPTSGGTMIGNNVVIKGGGITDGSFVMSAGSCGGYISLHGREKAESPRGVDIVVGGTDQILRLGYEQLLYGAENLQLNDLGGSAIVAQSYGVNGYVKRASGEITQWLTISEDTGWGTEEGGSYYKAFTLPIAFSSIYSCSWSGVVQQLSGYGGQLTMMRLDISSGGYVYATNKCRIRLMFIGY